MGQNIKQLFIQAADLRINPQAVNFLPAGFQHPGNRVRQGYH